jgi:signal transduction histidine kinase
MRGQSILLVSENAALCTAARINLEGRTAGLRVASVSSADAARRILRDAAPDVILLEERAPAAVRGRSAAATPAAGPCQEAPAPDTDLHADVSSLAKFAPVIVIGAAHREEAMASLLACGAACYVQRTCESWPVALHLVEQRLVQQRLAARSAERTPLQQTLEQESLENWPCETSGVAQKLSKVKDAMKNPGEPLEAEDFGEVLRHQLNNPLTGILGNAELLIAEIRRTDDGRLPPGGLQRLETITSLAVRMRETIRRISQEWVVTGVVGRGKPDL